MDEIESEVESEVEVVEPEAEVVAEGDGDTQVVPTMGRIVHVSPWEDPTDWVPGIVTSQSTGEVFTVAVFRHNATMIQSLVCRVAREGVTWRWPTR